MEFDPAALLNPKAAAQDSMKKERAQTKSQSPARRTLLSNGITSSPDSHRKTSSLGQPDPDREDTPVTGVANMIESMHNVAERQQLPRKRRKLEDDDTEDPKTSTFAASGGGVISDHLNAAIKPEDSTHSNGFEPHNRADHLEVSASLSPSPHSANGHDEDRKPAVQTAYDMIDVDDDDDEAPRPGTADRPLELDDDEDEQEAAEPAGDPLVCYGRLEGRTNIHRCPSPKSNQFQGIGTWPRIRCSTVRIPVRHDNTIVVKDPLGIDIGNLDIRISNGLASLMDTSVFKLWTEVNIYPRKRKEFELPGRACSESVRVCVCIGGPQSQATPVSTYLAARKLFLQDPGMLSRLPYVNPQAKAGQVQGSNGTQYRSTTTGARTAEEAEEALSNLFDSAVKSAEALEETEPPSSVLTKLLPHQKEALTFLLDHENPQQPVLWTHKQQTNGTTYWESIITTQQSTAMPSLVRGGILADEMGLGKTLSVLSLIASTLPAARSWAAGTAHRCKATLLVAPLSVVANWEEQIVTHLDGLNYLVYHGSRRWDNPKAFAQADVIITSYQIVSSELSGQNRATQGKSPFTRYEFYRVVLDEAHSIRTGTTAQARAACELKATRRWAVTGTPVQNRLSDLGSLLRFLRVAPFEDDGNFVRYVLTPFKQGAPGTLAKLRLLVCSLTLRRNKDKVDLPERVDRIVNVGLTEDERVIYDAYKREGKNRMAALSQKKQNLSGKSFAHVLRSILILRLLAIGGKDLLSEHDLEALEGLSAQTAISIEEEDEKPAITERMAYEMLKLCQETGTDTCASCNKALQPSADGDDKTVFGYILPCYQLVCVDCAPSVQNKMGDEARFACPYCGDWLRTALLRLTQDGANQAEEYKAQLQANPRHAKMIGRYTGPHSKTHALITHLLESRAHNAAHPDAPPIKSVVFSTWTTHLDLLQLGLAEHQFKWVRMDGKMNRAKRAEALRALREDRDVELILISVGAGGVGLNLTAACRVYMMGPLFNPAAENQAVDRVHRLGQTRPVVCTRFVTADSIEEALVELQERKKDLAELSLGKEKTETAQEKLERLKALFN